VRDRRLAQSFYNSALRVDYGRFGSSICVHLSLCGLFNHPLSIPNREIRKIGDLTNAVASPAMIIDGGVRSAEHHLPDEIIGQEIMREAEFDFGGLVQLGQLLIR
jgi:hypothetical protein